MNLRRFYAIGGLVLVLEIALTAWGIAQVGPDAIVPIHWGVDGEPDGFASAWIAFLIGPVVTALIIGLMAVIPRIEPRRENLRRSADAYRTVAIAVVVFMAVIHAVTVLSGVGIEVPVGALVGGGVGVLFAIIGNVLSTVRSNFLFGIRTPWTLASDRSWDRTHRLVGRL
ncbi:MAG TPA: SdpI family protein, partial [Gemmatimonadaceae bacterium]|nr:SdpI family protein [Gemmatimonadaceae bacterium]